MFGAKLRSKRQSNHAAVANFDDPAISAALSGRWLTLALSRFDATYSSKSDFRYLNNPVAYGVVHFQVGFEKHLRCKVTLQRDPAAAARGRVGSASLTAFTDPKEPYVLLEVSFADPRGKIEKALQGAFDAASQSEERFVHISFGREQLKVEPLLVELKTKGYGAYHPLNCVYLKRQVLLPKAPEWSWAWSRHY